MEFLMQVVKVLAAIISILVWIVMILPVYEVVYDAEVKRWERSMEYAKAISQAAWIVQLFAATPYAPMPSRARSLFSSIVISSATSALIYFLLTSGIR